MTRQPVNVISNNHEYDAVVDVDVDLTDAIIGSSQPFNNFSGSGTYIGNGIIITAAHVIGDNRAGYPINTNTRFGTGILTGTFNDRVGLDFGNGVTLLEGFSGELQFSAFSKNARQTLYSFGNDPDAAGPRTYQDIGLIRTAETSGPVTTNGFIIYADPNDASGSLWSAGYPNDVGGETLYETTTHLIAGNYQRGASAAGGTLNNGWLTNLVLKEGSSGSGVWIDPNLPFVPSGEYLVGVASTQGGFVDAIGDVYPELSNLLFTNFVLNPNDFATNVLIANDTGGTFNGTAFNEALYTSAADDVNNTMGGNDTIFGSVGNDTLSGGSGIDTLDYSTYAGGSVRVTLGSGGREDALKANQTRDRLDGFENVTLSGVDDFLLLNGISYMRHAA